MNARTVPYLLSILIALLSFLGLQMWTAQERNTNALTQNTRSLDQLTERFAHFKHFSEQMMEELKEGQEKMTDRMNRSGMRP